MSLKQSPIASAKEPLPGCWYRERDRQCLRIELDSGEAFLFRYHQFVAAHHVTSADGETLTISFSAHEVIISGRCLSEIVAALEDLAIRWIKPVRSRYRKIAELEGALVTDIEVRAAQ
jgi:hypothetical protein